MAFGTIAVAFVAVFQEWIKARFVRPKLSMQARVATPDCHKTRWGDQRGPEVYYFRIGVLNTGNAAAHDVQLYLANVEVQRQDKTYEPVRRFMHMNLLWAHTRQITVPAIWPNMPPRFCDLAHISDPASKPLVVNEDLPGVPAFEPILALDLEVKANTNGWLLEPRNIYRFTLILAAANHKPVTRHLEVSFPGVWSANEDQMLSHGFGMRFLD
jgi:hypothetical protein